MFRRSPGDNVYRQRCGKILEKLDSLSTRFCLKVSKTSVFRFEDRKDRFHSRRSARFAQRLIRRWAVSYASLAVCPDGFFWPGNTRFHRNYRSCRPNSEINAA